MKKKMTLALASSMFILALAAAPNRAQAAADNFLWFPNHDSTNVSILSTAVSVAASLLL
jgi:hypothetical protein